MKKNKYKYVRTHQDLHLIHSFVFMTFVFMTISGSVKVSFLKKIQYLELHFPNTLSNLKMTYVSNVDLDEWSNLGIHDFFS